MELLSDEEDDKSNKYKGFFQNKYKQQSRGNFDENDETEGKYFSGRVLEEDEEIQQANAAAAASDNPICN